MEFVVLDLGLAKKVVDVVLSETKVAGTEGLAVVGKIDLMVLGPKDPAFELFGVQDVARIAGLDFAVPVAVVGGGYNNLCLHDSKHNDLVEEH